MTRRDLLRLLALAAAGSSLGSRALAAQPAAPGGAARRLPRLRVHREGHYLETEDARPFFWLGDTAWLLIHATTREECSYYLRTRAAQGYTVIQTVVLSEFDGLNRPSLFGERPLFGNDPDRPNPAYFDRVAEIVDEARDRGLYVALVPAWGDKLTAPWGTGPRIFTADRLDVARRYGAYIGRLFRDRTNVIWLLGGDRPARLKGMNNPYLQKIAADAGFPPDQDWTPIWSALAAGLREGGEREPLTVFHPQGGKESSSQFIHNEPWLCVNGMQSGHGGGHDVPVWEWIARDYALVPPKPVIDLEPNYEDHPYNPWPKWDPSTGYFRDHDVRKQTYRSVFAGGCGVTYGHNAVWQFAGHRAEPMMFADRTWTDAVWRPGGRQMPFLRYLIESRPFFSRIPAQDMIVGQPTEGGRHMQATRDRTGTYALIYVPTSDQKVVVNAGALAPGRLRPWWYDPRTGVGARMDDIDGASSLEFTSPPDGPDWVLVLDRVNAGYGPPGLGVATA
jgi:Protein of unknown function (DUF4038)/Putative collagen-binding domain of a collagenase